MEQKHNQFPDLLFKIDIKVGERIVTLNVNEGDTIEGLLIKHKMVNQTNAQKFNSLKEKIKINIQKQTEIKIYSNQFELANKMKAFLQKANQASSAQTESQEFQRTQNRLNQKGFSSKTPFKLLFEKPQAQVKEQFKFSSSIQEGQVPEENQSKNGLVSQENALKQVSVTKNQVKIQKSKGSKSMSSKSRKYSHKENPSNKKTTYNKVDEDLIKAYEVIWKKSKDKIMRQMAQNTLRDLNALPEEGKINEFVPIENKNEHKSHFTSTENDESIQALTQIEMSQKYKISNEKSMRNDPFSESRSFMKKNYRYSYLEENSNLHYPYQKAQRSKEKYAYNRFDDTYINILNKDYDQKSYQKIHLNGPVNRRYNYLDD